MLKTKQTGGYAFFLIALLVFSGCSQHFYTPTNQNVLNFSEKGDAAVSGFVDFNECSGLNLGYAITNHIALSTDFKYFEKKEDGAYRNDSYMWDNELILFNKQDARKGYFIEAINLGYGIGEIARNSGYYGINATRMFAQPSIGYKIKGFEFAFSLRLASMKYDIRPGYDWNPDPNGQTLEQRFGTPRDGGRYLFTEPALTFGYGFKAIRFRVQKSWASHNSGDDFEYINNNMAISLSVNFNTIRRPNKE